MLDRYSYSSADSCTLGSSFATTLGSSFATTLGSSFTTALLDRSSYISPKKSAPSAISYVPN